MSNVYKDEARKWFDEYRTLPAWMQSNVVVRAAMEAFSLATAETPAFVPASLPDNELPSGTFEAVAEQLPQAA